MSIMEARTSLTDPIGLSVPMRGMTLISHNVTSKPYVYQGTGHDVITPRRGRPPARAKIRRNGEHSRLCYCNICQRARRKAS
ncbi:MULTISPECIES: hypothetical protein [unclassified Arthrobacter]|uniref:hypothetical protein n=1 Tax=unclassified Arthrobacter TaxID=235627 RepID=UPI0011B01504|nr:MULTISPECIES: hypothetical protein [unclassified Arthrobacter]